MDRVDSAVKLPSGAGQVSDYARRFYTFGENGEVIGLFAGQMGKKPHATGERLWVKSYKDFPLISDGGCGVVNVSFDLKSSKSQTWCNGVG
jgi:hypothetical protein